MNKKLLLFDLDDTLLTSDKKVSLLTTYAIEACKEQGMLIGYITARARPFKNEVFFVDHLPCDFIAYYNGAEICTRETSIESNVIPYEQAMMIIRKLNESYPNTGIAIYMEPWSWKNGGLWHMYTGEKKKCTLSELPEFNVQRIRLVFDENDSIPLHDFMTEESVFFRTADGTAIIVNNNATKERALIKASEYFGVSISNIIAFGDDINDVNMLKMSGIGVAMGNAIGKVKEVADYITETNDNEGISIWINKHLFNA